MPSCGVDASGSRANVLSSKSWCHGRLASRVLPSGPTASYSYACSGFTCSFDGRSSANAVSYAWTFGDGATASSATASHTFAARRSYTVTLTVRDASNASSSTSKTISCNPKKCQ